MSNSLKLGYINIQRRHYFLIKKRFVFRTSKIIVHYRHLRIKNAAQAVAKRQVVTIREKNTCLVVIKAKFPHFLNP
jgi:hypothetical protein